MKVKFEFETGYFNWKSYRSHNINEELEGLAIEEGCRRAFKCKHVRVYGGAQGYFDVWKWDEVKNCSIEKLGRISSVEVEDFEDF